MWPFGKSAEQRLKEAFEKNPVLSRYPLTVKVVKKTAVIEGEVPKESLVRLIKIVAEGINGIQDVDASRVVVTPQQIDTPHAPAEDAAVALAQAVLEKIKADPALTANPIDILQDGDRIIIRGAVDSEAEVEKARQLAASVPGVASVDVSGLQVITGAAKLNETDDDGDVVYTVKPGDTLSKIALHYYGSAAPDAYMKIARANDLADPNKIYVGQKLKIPGTVAGPDSELA